MTQAEKASSCGLGNNSWTCPLTPTAQNCNYGDAMYCVCDAGYGAGDVTKSCAPCVAGHFGPGGLNAAGNGPVPCSPCPAGQYSPAPGASSCTSCPAGQHSAGGATSCSECEGSSTMLPAAECSAWQDLFNAAGGPWNLYCPDPKVNPKLDPCGCVAPNGPVCNQTDNRTIVYLKFGGGGAKGTLPDSIGDFSSLKVLNFEVSGGRDLGGKIPASITKLSSLNLLHLEQNNFSGELPAWERWNDSKWWKQCNEPHCCYLANN